MSKIKGFGWTSDNYLPATADEFHTPKGSKSVHRSEGYTHSSHSHHGGGFERCHKSHPALKLPGTELVIHGGSCCNPVVTDADVYIGFDSGMQRTSARFPWNSGTEVYFKINDMSPPDDAVEFAKLVSWTKTQLEAGKKVHAGCIGGHGRTGTFLAALVSAFGEKDAIAYVRKHYCEKAVESSGQVKFLGKHFDVIPAPGHKDSHQTSSGSGKGRGKKGSLHHLHAPAGVVETYSPLLNRGSIWR